MDNINDLDFFEDDIVLALNGTELQQCMKLIYHVQRKLDLEREKSITVTDITHQTVAA